MVSHSACHCLTTSLFASAFDVALPDFLAFAMDFLDTARRGASGVLASTSVAMSDTVLSTWQF
jgi:hypothetical protein